MAKDVIHDQVKQALIKDGWTITHDPYTISFGGRHGYVDLGAEKILAAEKSGQQIAVEISFIGRSTVSELEKAVGQYAVYRSWLSRTEPQRIIYLAVDKRAFSDLFEDISGRVLLEDYSINMIVVDVAIQEVVKWVNM